MRPLSSILVLGAGELGTEVIRSLTEHPRRGDARIALLKRSQGKVQGATDDRIDYLTGDVVTMSEEELANMFKNFHTVICCNGMTLPAETQIKLAHAAIRSGISRYFPWQFGVDYDKIGRHSSQDLFTTQLAVRDILRGQTQLKWVIVSTVRGVPIGG